jgi:transketolase
MRIRSARFLALALAIGIAAPLFAQRQPGGMGRGGISASMLLGQKSVQEELKLTEDQISKIEKSSKDIRAKFADDVKDKDKRTEAFKKMAEETAKLLPDLVKPEQLKRLKQIEIQLGGLMALTHEDVQKTLKMTDKQVSDVKGLSEDLAKDQQAMFKDAGKDKDKAKEAREKVATLRKEATTKFLTGLTADQKKAYAELTGAEFKGKIEFGMGRRPGADKE